MTESEELNQLLSKSPPKSGSKRPTLAANAVPIEDWDEDDVVDQIEKSFVQWSSHNGQTFVPAAKTRHKLLPGVYEIRSNPNIGIYFEKIPVKTEGLIRFPDSNSNKVLDEIQKFWSEEVEENFRKYGLAYKRGILLWGCAGGGKSSTVQLVMEDVVKRGGVVVKFDNPFVFIEGMRIFRRIQSDTPVVVSMEDIDSILEQYSETEVLNILDGVNDVSRMVFLATTNYPEELGERIVNRPSRFDKRFKIGFPNSDARRMYFEHLIKKRDLKNIDLDQWVRDTDKMSIAHLKELFINVVILGNDYAEAIETLKTMKERMDHRDNDEMMGFRTED